MTTKLAIPRILSLDLMRGWFLIVIILDHLSYFPNGMALITGDSRLFVTAAEGFFIISGLVLGIVRGAKLVDAPFWTAAKKLLHRGFILYLTSIIVTTILLVISWQFIGNDGVKSPIPPPDSNPLLLAWNIITLQEFYGWADYLRLYALFLFVSPLFLWLLRKGKWYIGLLASATIWLLAPRPTPEVLQPLTWQFLFFIAFTIGFYWPQIISWWRAQSPHFQIIARRATLTVFGMTLGLNAVAVFLAPAIDLPLFHMITDLHATLNLHMLKNDLSLGRLMLAFVWFAGFFVIFRRFEQTIARYFGWILIPFGMNSLYVYTLHAFVITGMHLIVNPQYGNASVTLLSFDRIVQIPANLMLSILAVGIIYLCVRTKFLMRVIPR